MKELRRSAIHLALLALAALVAYASSRPKDAADKPLAPGEIELWRGKVEDVTAVSYEDERKKITLEKKSDAAGIWYLGRVEPKAAAEPEQKDGDAKADKAPKPTPVEAATFASATTAKKVATDLATFRAKRAIGSIEGERLGEFGLDKPEGTLRVTVAGTEHVLVLGANAPGTGDRYVQDQATKAVYVVDATPSRDVAAGAVRLREANQHEWKFTDVDATSLTVGGAARSIVRGGTEGRRFWADAATPDVNDETVGNWLTKVERLRPTSHLEKMPEGAERVLRVEYRGNKKELGFFELWHTGDKDAPFAVVTEQLRLPAPVGKAQAEQLVDDLGSVVPSADVSKWKSAPVPATSSEPAAGEPPAGAATSAPTASPTAGPHGAPHGAPHGPATDPQGAPIHGHR